MTNLMKVFSSHIHFDIIKSIELDPANKSQINKIIMNLIILKKWVKIKKFRRIILN